MNKITRTNTGPVESSVAAKLIADATLFIDKVSCRLILKFGKVVGRIVYWQHADGGYLAIDTSCYEIYLVDADLKPTDLEISQDLIWEMWDIAEAIYEIVKMGANLPFTASNHLINETRYLDAVKKKKARLTE